MSALELTWVDESTLNPRRSGYRLRMQGYNGFIGCFLILRYAGTYRLYDDRRDYTGVNAHVAEGSLDAMMLLGLSMAMEEQS